jgi:DtxR family transcriptional regulator, Mn-dependent transcriptional regulator
MHTATEENYLKAIFQLSENDPETISTNALAAVLDTSAASVTDMLKRLTDKGLTAYERYKGVRLTASGEQIAIQLVRKHRLWETFLVEQLKFSWDEVHSIAEELEHIQSTELINRLELFLNFPKFDPHGDPIPDKDGKMEQRKQVFISELQVPQQAVVVGVFEHSPSFLQYVEQLGLTIGTEIAILEKYPFDDSVRLLLNQTTEKVISFKVCQNLYAKIL